MKRILLLFAGAIYTANLFSQKFVEVQNVFPSIHYAHSQFLDFDSDNDLDICVWGINEEVSTNYLSLVVFKNNGNDNFESIKADTLISCQGGIIEHINVSDINADNIPEIAYTGNNNILKFNQYTDSLFHQPSGNYFENISSYSYSGANFSDFDNDGSVELLMDMSIYDQNKKIYTDLSFNKINREWSRWIDMNNDGKDDIFRIHFDPPYGENASCYTYMNNGSSFDSTSFYFCDIPWTLEVSDYNNDGYEDVIIFVYKEGMGYDPTAELYRNDKNGNFTFVKDIANASSGRFSDIDNDGDLDLLLMGHREPGVSFFLKFFQNNGGDDFVELQNDSISTFNYGDIVVRDYDNDGDNDFIISNVDYSNNVLRLFKNYLVEDNPILANKAPSEPLNLNSEINFNRAILRWDTAIDNETPSNAITYNVFIKKSDGTFITSPIADVNNGFRKIGYKGNAGYNNYYEINCLEEGKYYWSVQSIDNSNKGSEFAAIDSFEIENTTPEAPTLLESKTKSDKIVHLNWTDNSNIEDGFTIEMYYDSIPYFRSAGFYPIKKLSANITECDIDNLNPNTKYVFRISAYNCSSQSTISNLDTVSTYPVNFTEKILLDNYYGREAEWGDFDRDGDLDILIFYTQGDAYGNAYSLILENEIDTLIPLEVGLPRVEYFGSSRNGSLNWVDFNNDGLLDIFLIEGEPFSALCRIFKNNGNKTFTDIKCDSILSIVPGSCGPSFSDYDNDGDLDILLMGTNKSSHKIETKIYENYGGGKFEDSGISNLTGIIKSRMPWADFNNDGYLDILANEPKSDGTSNIVVFKNNGNKTFSKIIFNNLIGLNEDYNNQSGDMRWGDYNNDGFIDILISGAHTGSNGIGITRIYKNNGNESFIDSGINNIYGMCQDVSIEWGDYNNDGIMDFLQTGDGWIDGVIGKTRIYFSENNIFEKEIDESFLEVHQCGMSTAADYDLDGDLDILVLGQENYTHHQIALYNNFQNIKNTRPEIPSNLHVEFIGNKVVLRWDESNDNETTSKGLSYNVYLVGNDDTIVQPSSLENGVRTIVGLGNAQQNTFYSINNLETGHYKWSVQCIDNCFEGSSFAEEKTFDFVKSNIKDNELILTTIYPNPCDIYINIEAINSSNRKYNIVVYDLMGNECNAVNDISLPYKLFTSSLNSGIYLLEIIQDNSISKIKFIKK